MARPGMLVGQMQFTRMLSGAYSLAIFCVIPITALFAAA